jgi:hypothetical protein
MLNWFKQMIKTVRARFWKESQAEVVDYAVLLPINNSPGKYVFFCPGCQTGHMINVDPSQGKPCHTLTGTLDKPTVRASVLTNSYLPRCHSFITNGRIEFLRDCEHDLAGKTVDLQPF